MSEDNLTAVLYQPKDLRLGEAYDKCEACLKGKMSTKPFPKVSSSRTTQPLQLIHSDVAGPLPEASWGGAVYVLAFTDDYTRKTFGYLMKSKSQEQTPIPQINDDEVLLRMDCVGICGSDVHYWQSGSCGHFVLKEPMIMGHESSGVVTKVGAKVKHLVPGDRVAIEPGVPCRYCEFCKTGRYHLCPDIIFCATPPVHGNLARYYKHAADFCYKLPDHVSMEEGALLEPLSVGIHACRRAGVTGGSTVLVLGAGPIGLVTLLAAKAFGASKVLITDILQSRLDFAKKIGADATMLVTRDDKEADLVARTHEILGEHPDFSIDASGAQSTVRLAMMATKSGGTAVLVGMGSPELTVPLAAAMAREVDIRGIFRYVNEYPIALSMVASGKINVKPLVTHHFSLEETLQAYEVARQGAGIKVMIHVQPRDTNNPIKF